MSTNLAQIDTKKIETGMALLKARAEAIIVSDGEAYAAACQIAVEVRAEIKAIGFAFDPGIEDAKRHLDMLRNQKKMFVDRLTPIVDIATGKAERWKAEERRKAQAEQDRINAERRAEAAHIAEAERKEAEDKAEAERKERERQAEEVRKENERLIKDQLRRGDIGKREAEKLKKQEAEDAARIKKQAAEEEERQRKLAAEQAEATRNNVQEVKVAPAVPKVAGIRALVVWKYRIVNEALIPRRYWMPDAVSIGEMVRRTKDKNKSEAECPGIEVFTEDSV